MTKVRVTKHNQNYDYHDYLTIGQTYEIDNDSGTTFHLLNDDEGDFLICCWENCLHGYEYELVEGE